MKTVAAGAHYTTVTVDTAEAVKFSFPSTSLSVEAAGGDITVALTETAQAGDDETITVPDGESRMFIHHRMGVDTYYLSGSGTATLYASNMADVNPFKKKARGGESVTVTALSVTENGTYTAPTGTAYSPVVVDVPQTTLTTLDVTENGTYTAPSGSAYNEVNVDVPLPENAYLLEEYEDVPTDIASFTASDAPLKSLTASIVPMQDLHGYDSPWVGGAGKNKLPSGKAQTITIAGVTITSDGNGIYSFSGTASTDGSAIFNCDEFVIPDFENATIYFMNNVNFDFVFLYNNTTVETWSVRENNRKSTYSAMKGKTCNKLRITILAGTNYSNGKISPMICDNANETTFAPYSNICPISGWDEVNVTVADNVDNPTVAHTYTIPFTDEQGQSVEVFGGSVDVVNGTSGNEKTKEGVDLSTLTWEVRYTGEVNQTVSSSLPSKYLQRTPVFMAEQYVRNGYVGEVASLNNPDERPIGIWNYQGSSSTETSTTTTIYMVVSKNTTPQGKLVYDIATPTTFYTQPTAVKSLLGSNNIWADTGDVIEGEYFSEGSDYMRKTVLLWENDGRTNPETITLSEAWSDFDELAIVTDYIDNNTHVWGYNTIQNTYNIGDYVRLWFHDQHVYAIYAVTSSTVLTKYAENGGDWVSKIIGIKY